ncbi:MAG TPA: NAD(P)-dependent oxidoreductase [Candidatus Dormibacteraeota bacterium]|nr:NAD(P)-dependent oxidoreductase [Candidatus Dormibacteraeota bacterium]
MKVVVTGGCGFIGRSLTEHLRAAGHDAVAADVRVPEESGEGVRRVDVLDLDELRAAVSGAGVVYHLAGPVLGTARKDPFRSSTLQLAGTLNVLEACRATGVRKVVLASSFYVYDGLPADGIVNESSRLDPSRMELFGSLKVAAEQLVLGYARRFGMRFVLLRFGSAYGWGEGSNLVQEFLATGLAGRPLEVWGPGLRSNQYTYVDDIARGALAALDVDDETFNLISPDETSTSELARLMCRRFGFEMRLLMDKPEGPDFPYMSARKAARQLAWTITPLEEALDTLVAQQFASAPREPARA